MIFRSAGPRGAEAGRVWCVRGRKREGGSGPKRAGRRSRKIEGKGGLLGRQQARAEEGKEVNCQASSWGWAENEEREFFKILFYFQILFLFLIQNNFKYEPNQV